MERVAIYKETVRHHGTDQGIHYAETSSSKIIRVKPENSEEIPNLSGYWK